MAERGTSPERNGSTGRNSEVSEVFSTSGGERSVFSSTYAELESVSVREKNEHSERNNKNEVNVFASTWEQLERVSDRKKAPVEEREGGYHPSTYEELERVSIHNKRAPETGEGKVEDIEIRTVDINARLNELRADSEAAMAVINRNSLSDRISRDNEFYVLPNKLRGEKADTPEATSALAEIEAAQRKNYLDTTRAKGFVQEEMIKSVLEDDFEVSDKTVKSEHADGSITYTDIVAVAINDIQLGNITIRQGETLSIESKAGDEKYLASQIEHISKQLEGMDKDSHRMLFVTADYHRMNDEKKERLSNVLEENDASLNILPYYAHDLTNTILHMDIEEPQESDFSESESDIELPESIEPSQETVELQDVKSVTDERLLSNRQEKKEADSESAGKSKSERTEKSESEGLTLRERFEMDKAETIRIISENKHLSELNESERETLANTALIITVEHHKPELTDQEIEDIRNKIHFVDREHVINSLNASVSEEAAKYIQGYYDLKAGVNINIDAEGADAQETLVTIDHEVLHMITQQRGIFNIPVRGMTGLKRGDLANSYNTGMNEGVTEMYASDDMEELIPEREEQSYIEEVGVMRKYREIIGDNALHNAYMNNDHRFLRADYDKHMGNGSFDKLCNKIDQMWYAEKIGDFRLADMLHDEIDDELDNYRNNREDSENENR